MTTIAAIATPAGYGGIGIIKISGPESIRIARRVFRRTCPDTPKKQHPGKERFDTHRLYLGNIADYQNGRIIDQVLMVVMRAPHSYTTEDVVEIQAHSGPVTLQKILELILRSGARMAEPGEFTKRAFINGRIDLTQAEAVMDIIHARSQTANEAAAAQINGRLKKRINHLRRELQNIYAFIEANIDFPEDVEDPIDVDHIQAALKESLIEPLIELMEQHDRMRFFRDGLSLAIVGKPNVGKSSLLNCLLQQDRAIVTEQPGTTRDIIREQVIIKGIPVDILDTAGIRCYADHIEKLGIKKTEDALGVADIILFVIDASQLLDSDDDRIHRMVANKQHILVFNKMDIIEQTGVGPTRIPDHWHNQHPLQISAKHGKGIGALYKAIENLTVGSLSERTQSALIPNLRHKLLIKRGLERALQARRGLAEGQSVELVAIDLQETLQCLDDIVGIRASTDILDKVFEQFCIGK